MRSDKISVFFVVASPIQFQIMPRSETTYMIRIHKNTMLATPDT
jgi:hypothetical protein